MATTFVTAFLDLKEDRTKDKSTDTCFNHFLSILNTRVPIVLFLSKCFLERLKGVDTSNVTIVPIELDELDIYKHAVSAGPLTLPSNRTSHHDTLNFMILMNAKIEFVHRAISINPYSTEQFAWIDFSICHVFRQPALSLAFLHCLSNTRLKTGLYFPGCWDKGLGYNYVYDAIHWRFAGGFFIGDKESLEAMYSLYMNVYPKLLAWRKRILWEVNVWTILEYEYGFSPMWYKSGHDDSIIKIPSSSIYVVASLTTIPSRIGTSCKSAIDSLITQVDRVYLSVASFYKRFNTSIELPSYLLEEPYINKVQVVQGEDKGPATKYLGSLAVIPRHSWIFFCDDDQEYSPNLVNIMLSRIVIYGVYQNRYSIIQQTTSGGLIHGFVGNMANVEMLNDLSGFSLPECAYHIDDQWMSVYYFLHNIPILPTGIEIYSHIYRRLENNHELLGSDSLASLGTREDRVKQLADHFNVDFLSLGNISRRA